MPAPQEATYSKEFFPLENCGVLIGKGIQKNDRRLKLLLDRITNYGGKYKFVNSLENDCDTVFAIGDTEFSEDLKIPEKPQGYAVKCFEEDGKKIVAFNSSDHLGMTWAVNSLIQMITMNGTNTVLHAVDVQDYPFIIGRGCKGPNTKDFVSTSRIYPLMTKLDWIFYSKSLLVPRRAAPRAWIDWRPPRPKKLTDKVAAIGNNLKGLGMTWEVGIMPFTIGNGIKELIQLDCKGDKHFDIVWKMCLPILKAGGGICYSPDDYRFPISPEDKKNFGTAREADIYFINRLYKKMKENFPEATMTIIQPFYWGPTGQNPWSKESPIDYLKGIGERLPKDVGICWSGPSVKTAGFDKQDVAKMAALIKRKPYFFQNSSDFHHIYRYIYPGDVIKWWLNTKRDKDVYKELNGAVFNSLGIYPDMLWSAMLWNPDGYDAKEAAYQATCKLVGPENYELVSRLVKTMSYFDQYGNLKQTPLAARNFKKIESKLAESKKLSLEYENNETHPAAVKKWASLSWPIRGIDVVLYQKLKKNKDLKHFINQGAETEEKAKKEMKFDSGTDQIFTAYNFRDSYKPRKIRKRFATWIYGAKSKTPKMSLAFGIEPYPPLTDYVLLICGQDGGKEENCRIEISLNGKIIFKGANPFKRNEWTVQSFKIPLPALQRSNKLTISNIEDSAKSGVPFFMLNYAVVRKVKN